MLARIEEQELYPVEELFECNAKVIEVTSDSEEQKFDDELKKPELNLKKSRKSIYGKGSESIAIKKELGDFDAFNSETYKFIINRYGRSIRFTELLGIISSLQIYYRCKKNITLPLLSRNEKRSLPLLIKYIERNRELIIPCLQYISLGDSSFQKIPLDTK